jgi:2-keto-4-pentenoate hydratase
VAIPDATPDATRVAHTVASLLGARRASATLAMLARAYAPTSLEEAFAVQREMTRQLGARIGGWKVGYAPGVRLTHAPIYQDACLASGASVHLPYAEAPAIEGEVAFVLGRNVPARATPYSDEEIAAAVDEVCAAIEVGAPRLRDFMAAPIEHKIADNMGNGALICGSGTRAWRAIDLAALRVRVEIDGRVVTDLIGGNSAGNPFNALVALANAPHRREPLQAGQIVISGTCTGLYAAHAGNEAKVVFDGLGEARVTLV